MKNKRIIIISIILLFIMIFSTSCVSNESTEESILQHISYKYYKNEDEYTVMIKEQGKYVPYLVITDEYDDGETCLLLRKYLLDEYMRYGENDQYNPSYYGRSELGKYLDEEFIKNFSQEMQGMILESDVEISAYESIQTMDEKTEYIRRKIFLLSYYELGYEYNSAINLEGEPLQYFDSVERRIAYKEDGKKGEWWLRTPELRSISIVMGVTMNGEGAGCGICGLSSYYELGVRPAFCLPRDTSIIEVDGVYYIEEDYNSLDVMNNAEDRSELLYEDVLVRHMAERAPKVPSECRPEGYDDVYIKPALACEMEAHKDDKEHKFHTIIYSGNLADWQEVLFNINNDNANGVYLNMDYWIPKECEDGFDRYYYVFTADEIYALAENEIYCTYVGTGTCDMEKANWDTTEGILEYCELYGDGYIAN